LRLLFYLCSNIMCKKCVLDPCMLASSKKFWGWRSKTQNYNLIWFKIQ